MPQFNSAVVIPDSRKRSLINPTVFCTCEGFPQGAILVGAPILRRAPTIYDRERCYPSPLVRLPISDRERLFVSAQPQRGHTAYTPRCSRLESFEISMFEPESMGRTWSEQARSGNPNLVRPNATELQFGGGGHA